MDSGSAAAAGGAWLRRLVGAVGRRVAEARAQRSLRAEFDTLERAGALDDVLRDVDMTRTDLAAIVKADPGAARRLAAMAARLGLADALRRHGARRDVREIELACTRCAATGECDTWLRGSQAGGNEKFCPNAAALQALRD